MSASTKIITPETARTLTKEAKSRGEKVVLAHGVFDLLHLGHVRHLEAARYEGEVLIVSVTEDAHVNKGPGRPVFPSLMRAEMLASLSIVDWIVINDAPTAVPVLKTIEPNVYIKGSEYRHADDDITGMIAKEQEAVEASGGRIVFTDDIVFSSSAMINKYMNVHDPALRNYLEGFSMHSSLEDVTSLIDQVSEYKVLLVGDAIIDEYQFVRSMGKSSKENMIATKFLDHEQYCGGVFAAANHVASFCRDVEIVTCLGAENTGEALCKQQLKPNVKLNYILRDSAPTTKKSRFVDSNYLRKMFEVYHFEDNPLPAPRQEEFDNLIAAKASEFDVVIVADFGHGLITDSTISVLEDKANYLAVNAQSNSANHGYNLITKYSKADYICIDEPEARLAVIDKDNSIEQVILEKLAPETSCDRIIVTRGEFGCMAYDKGRPLHSIPAFTRTIVDSVGAGDAFLSVTSPLASTGASLDLVGFIGNAAGALKVGIVGHRASVEKVPLIKYITHLLK